MRKAVRPYGQVQQSGIDSHLSRTSKLQKVQLFSQSYSPANRRMTIYTVGPIKRTPEEKENKRQGQPATPGGGKTTHGRLGSQGRDEDEVSVDRFVRTARLGTPIRSAGYRISARRWTKKGTSAYRTTANNNA